MALEHSGAIAIICIWKSLKITQKFTKSQVGETWKFQGSQRSSFSCCVFPPIQLISRVNRLSNATSSGRLSCSGLQPALVSFGDVEQPVFCEAWSSGQQWCFCLVWYGVIHAFFLLPDLDPQPSNFDKFPPIFPHILIGNQTCPLHFCEFVIRKCRQTAANRKK